MIKRPRIFVAACAAAALVSVSGCISSNPPIAISKSTYTAITPEEHQLLPEDLDLLTLEDAQSLAVQNSPTFKSAYFAISAARAAYYQSYSAYFPTLTASYTVGQSYFEPLNRTAGNASQTTNSTPSLNLNMTVFDSLQREMNILAMKHNLLATEAAEEDAHRILLRSVAYAYNDVLLAQANIRIAIADMEYNRKLLDETTLKFEAGASTLSDVLNFKINFNSAESSLYDAEYSCAVAKYALAQLMGLTEGDIPDHVKFPEMPSPDGEMLADITVYLDMALQNRPDLKEYREVLESSKYGYYNSIAAFGPTISFSSSVNYSNSRNNIRGRWGEPNKGSRSRGSNISYGATVSWEIFSGGSTYFNMRAQEAYMTQAEYQLEE